MVHRVGYLPLGEAIVLVLTASAHRGDAFAACEFIMDTSSATRRSGKRTHRRRQSLGGSQTQRPTGGATVAISHCAAAGLVSQARRMGGVDKGQTPASAKHWPRMCWPAWPRKASRQRAA